MATVHDMLKCPKCNKKMMGKAIPQAFGKEYFAHCCHEYFGVNELVNQWGCDAADLYPSYPVTYADYKNWIPKGNYPITVYIDYEGQEMSAFLPLNRPNYSEFDGGELYWNNLAEYQDAQAMVGRMIMGIPEIDDYVDMISTYEDALGIGVQ